MSGLEIRSLNHLFKEKWSKLGNVSLDQNLKLIKAPIMVWNKESIGVIGERIRKIGHEIHSLDSKRDKIQLSTVEWARLKALNAELTR